MIRALPLCLLFLALPACTTFPQVAAQAGKGLGPAPALLPMDELILLAAPPGAPAQTGAATDAQAAALRARAAALRAR